MAEAGTLSNVSERARRKIAERLLGRERAIADDLRLIEEDKNALRAIAEEIREGFKVEIEGLGTVEVKAPREKELTGTRPELIVAGYLALPPKRQEKLVEDGIVQVVEVWKAAAKPSVTVRL